MGQPSGQQSLVLSDQLFVHVRRHLPDRRVSRLFRYVNLIMSDK